jgi:hypothetical protein
MKKRTVIIACICIFILLGSLFAQKLDATIKHGKYGCTASKYVNGSYEYIPRGSFILNKNGTYSYLGFEKPSNGKFVVEQNGDLSFIGGYLDKGKAEKTDRPNRYLVVFPSNPDNRWTCSAIEK